MEQEVVEKYIGDSLTHDHINHLITCDRTNEKCEEKVLKEYLKKQNDKLEHENEILLRDVAEYKDLLKSCGKQSSKFNKQRKKVEFNFANMIERMNKIIISFDGVNAEVHSSLIVKLFRNAIDKSYNEDKVISQINKIKDPVERRLGSIED